MVGIKITNLKQAIALNEIEKLKFGELLSMVMDKASLNPDLLSEKISKDALRKGEYCNISPKAISYYLKGKRGVKRPPKENDKNLIFMAESLGTTQYELLQDYALVNLEADELPDDTYYWRESIENIKRKLTGLSSEYVTLLCNSYKTVLSIPMEAIDIAVMFSRLNEESQTQFWAYIGILQNDFNSMLCTKYVHIFEVITKTCDKSNGTIIDLSQLIKSTFPNKENFKEAETFDLYLYTLLNEKWREISKAYLALDSEIKREMILRIVDQMLAIQNHVIE